MPAPESIFQSLEGPYELRDIFNTDLQANLLLGTQVSIVSVKYSEPTIVPTSDDAPPPTPSTPLQTYPPSTGKMIDIPVMGEGTPSGKKS